MTEITFTTFVWTAAPVFVSCLALWAVSSVAATLRDMRADHKIDIQALIRTLIRQELSQQRAEASQVEFLQELERFKPPQNTQ